MNFQTQVLIELLASAPSIILLGIVAFWFWRVRRKSRVPVRDKLLRAPGETLRRRRQKFDDNILFYGVGVLLYGPVCFFLFALYVKWRLKSPHLGTEMICFGVVVLFLTILIAWRIIKVLQRDRNDGLGLRGERAVGEELNKLMLDGCLVYHDIPGEGDWNVDHVVVAPSGVYAVETKTRSKAKCAEDRRDYEVFYDGRTLQFPTWTDAHGIEQAKASAKWLAKYLSNTLAEEIKVTPILTLPGWLVTSRVHPSGNELRVLSHKKVRDAIIDGRTPIIGEKLMGQIGYQLELKCRDVEF